MINIYPTVEFADKLLLISKCNPPLPNAPTKPIMPKKPVVNSEESGCGTTLFSLIGTVFLMLCVLSLFTTQFKEALIFGIVTIVSLLIFNTLINSESNIVLQNIENEKKYNENIKKYNEDIKHYNKLVEDYEYKIKEIKTNEYILNYRNIQLQKHCINNTILINLLKKAISHLNQLLFHSLSHIYIKNSQMPMF